MAAPVLVVRRKIAWGGRRAADPNAPPALAIDGAGDGLEIGPRGDFLAAGPAASWTGRTALDPGAEVDLGIDAAGDRLNID